MEEGLSHFTEVLTEDDNEVEATAKEEAVSDSKKEKKIKKNLQKEQRDARIAKRLRQSIGGRRRFSSVFASPSVRGCRRASSATALTGSSASSALSAPSAPAVPVSRSSAPSAPPAPSAPFVSGSGSSTLSALPTPSAPVVPVSGSSTPSVPSGLAVPVSGSFTPSALFASFLQTPTLRKQRLIKLNGRKMRATSEELAPVYTRQLSSGQLLSSPLLFSSRPVLSPTSRIGEKQSFDKAFDINSRPLVKDHTGEEVDLSFADCHCLIAVKANKV